MLEGREPLELTAEEARVLGALLEKQLTTPDAYPLSLAALTAACNQTSNRHPVVRYAPSEVEAAVLALKGRRLARVVHPGSGERVAKYRQVADEALALAPPARALVCALLLRGGQTVSELKARTERLHRFPSTGAVETALDDLARRDPPLAARTGRQAGQKEPRWIQLLEAGAEERAAAAPATVDAGPTDRAREGDLERRVAALEARLGALVEALGDLVDLDEDGAAP